jgi:capsular polysaccharide biosynthesis protein
MTSPEVPAADPGLSEELARIASFLRRALRFWRVPLLTLLLGAAAYAVFTFLNQPKYRSETVILYVEKGTTDEETESSDAQRSVTVRLKELLFARPNLERVITDYGLYPELRKTYGMVDAIEELKKHVDFRAPGGDTFSIAFQGGSPNQAQAVTAELARLVIDGDAELRKDQAKVALDFLVNERQARDAELRGAEEKLAAFMAEHPRFALDTTPLANGAAIRASLSGAPGAPPPGKLSWAPRLANGDLKSSAPVGAALPSAARPDAEEARARAELAAARETLTEKLVHYTPAHPDVRAAELAVQRANERVAAIVAATPPHVGVADPPSAPTPPAPTASTGPASRSGAPLPRLVAAAPAAAPASESSQALVTLETDWLKLTRAVTEARQRLDQIEARLFRADIEVSSETGRHGVQVNVIDPAFLPQRPLPPGRFTWALIFAAASLALGALVALVFAIFDERIFAGRDAEALTEVLVEVPKNSRRRMYVAS